MSDKIKITNAVQDILNRSPNWLPTIVNGLASPSKVARQIHSEVAKVVGSPVKDIRLDTIIKAVKTYVAGREKVSDIEKVKKLIADCKLTLMSDLATITVKTGPDSKRLITQIIELVYHNDQRLYFGQGALHTTFIFSRENFSKIKALFKPSEIIDTNTDYAGILMDSPALISYNPISYDAYILSMIASHGIPIAGYMSLLSETIILVKDKDSLEAFKILKSEVERLRQSR